MEKELSHENELVLEHFLSFFKIYHEGIADKTELKEKSKKLFFEMCEDHNIDPRLAVNFLSKRFQELDSRERKVSTYETFENMGKVVDIDEYEEK